MTSTSSSPQTGSAPHEPALSPSALSRSARVASTRAESPHPEPPRSEPRQGGPAARSSEPPRGPTPLTERSVAPDLARGLMLLFIALAHAPWFLYASEFGEGTMHPLDSGVLNRAVQAATIVLVDARTMPLFALLFAYGIGQLYARQHAKGVSDADARRLLRRRHLWMVVFGTVHAALLWQGDILATYGILGLIMVPLFISRRPRTLAIWAGALTGVVGMLAVLGPLAASMGPDPDPDQEGSAQADLQHASIGESFYPLAAVVRLATWLMGTTSGVLSLVLPAAVLLGLLAAKHRVLDEPGRHLRLLRVTAAVGLLLGWGGAVPHALTHLGVVGDAGAATFTSLHFFSGLSAGAGYAALFGLLAHRFERAGQRNALPVRAIGALGRRSLSGYLAQSVIYAPLLTAWGLGAGAHFSSGSAALLAVGVWMVTVIGAYLLERHSRRGPAETLLRRLTYPRA